MTKIRHFYAHHDPSVAGPHDSERDLVPDSLLTEGMVRKILDCFGSSSSPFMLIAPSSILHEFGSWTIPKNLLDVVRVEGKPETDCSACDKARLFCGDNVVFIYARRLLPMLEMTGREKLRFAALHPRAHMVIGDFEIRSLKPEKYHL